VNTQRADFLDRLSISRPGYRLLELVDAALPMFLVRADILMVERRPIGPLEEFALKSIDHGFVTPTEIGGVLGLESDLVLETLSGLMREDLVMQRLQGGARVMHLTQRGAVLLETRLREAPTRGQFRIGFDRILWEVTAEAQSHLLRPKEVEESGRWQLRPKLKRKPKADEFRLEAIESEVRSLRSRADKPTVLALERIVRADQFFLPVDVAVFESLDGGPPQLSVLVDGRPSPAHESAIERLGGIEFVGAEVLAGSTDPSSALAEDYGPDAVSELTAAASTSSDRDMARRDRVAVVSTSPKPSGDPAPVQPAPLTTSAVQFIDTFEHREYLRQALQETKERLVIISPWIAASVVTSGFLEQLGQLVNRGVCVHIGYGLEQRPGERFVSDADMKAESALRRMADRHDNFSFVKLGNTHSKQLLFDDVHISGSYNWLSFQGSRKKEYRHEESTVVRIKSKVDKKYGDLCARLEARSNEM
jgi:hypothetical protein